MSTASKKDDLQLSTHFPVQTEVPVAWSERFESDSVIYIYISQCGSYLSPT